MPTYYVTEVKNNLTITAHYVTGIKSRLVNTTSDVIKLKTSSGYITLLPADKPLQVTVHKETVICYPIQEHSVYIEANSFHGKFNEDFPESGDIVITSIVAEVMYRSQIQYSGGEVFTYDFGQLTLHPMLTYKTPK
jgi:hypothetical protein